MATLRTSNLDFQLTQLSQWERRRWNGKVERSAENVLFNTGFTTSANGGGGQQLLCSGKPVCGESIMWNHHESKRAKIRVTACTKVFSRYVQRASSPNVTVSRHSLRWALSLPRSAQCPPACGKVVG